MKVQHGFTLVEMLVVMVILGLLAALVVPQITKYMEKAKYQNAVHRLTSIENAIERYRLDLAELPSSLSSLIGNDTDNVSWYGPYLKRGAINDPWGVEFQYEIDERGGYDVVTFAKDQLPGGVRFNADIRLSER